MNNFNISCIIKDPSKFKMGGDVFKEIHNNSEYAVSVLGDCIGFINNDKTFRTNTEIAQWVIDNLKGHFYYLIQNKNNPSFIIGNSNFSILPVYYSEDKDHLYLSNNVETISSKLCSLTINKRFILENILFNYPLFNETVYTEIKLLPSNSYIEIKEGSFKINSLNPIEDYFVSEPKPWRKSVNSISELFIENSKQYFPDEKYATSLTGGFDGRTLCSLGKYHNKDFSTYSFGSPDSPDVKIAKHLSSLAQLEFQQFELNKEYIENRSLDNGLEFIKGSNGIASFARAHYMDSIKKLSKNYNYIITGNFGSEVFRAAHIAGVVISPNLYYLFSSKSFDEGISKVESSNEFQWLDKDKFRSEWESLKGDLSTLPCYDMELRGMSKNEQFYKFVFEEIFRKYFGAEMINQYQYLINRTPFLDFDFIKEILKTQLSGVYSNYFENNPLKRFKGQVVYGNIIQKTYPNFGRELTDKGYCPADLLSFSGKLKITRSYIGKKILKNKITAKDPYAVQSAFEKNIEYWRNLEINTTLFNNNRIQNCSNSGFLF